MLGGACGADSEKVLYLAVARPWPELERGQDWHGGSETHLSFRASIGVTGLLEKKLEAFAEDKKIIEAERECLEFGYADQLQKIRFKIRLMIKPIEELIEPYLAFLPAQVRYNWDRFHEVAFPILRENGRGVSLPPRSREERARTRSRTPKKAPIKKYVVLSRALARNEKQVVKNYNSVLHKKEEFPFKTLS